MQARRQVNLCLWCKLPVFGLCSVLRSGVVVVMNVSLLFLWRTIFMSLNSHTALLPSQCHSFLFLGNIYQMNILCAII